MVSLFRSIWLMRLIQAFVNCSRLGSLPPSRNTLLQVFFSLSLIQSPPIFIYALWDVHFPALPETMEMAKKQFFAAKTTLPFCLRKIFHPSSFRNRLSFQRCSRAESPQHLWIPHRLSGRPGRPGSPAVPAGTGSGTLPAVRRSTGNRQRSPESKTLVLQISKSL